jgi:cell division protein FtsN
MDSLGALIATLPPSPSPAPSQPAPATVPQAKTPPAPQAATPAAAARRDPAPAPAPATGTYYLQAGAYTAAVDAESLKARIIMMGLPVAVQQAEVNGMQINRVRVGPFSRLDDMNRARSRLGKNKIESAIVRQ